MEKTSANSFSGNPNTELPDPPDAILNHAENPNLQLQDFLYVLSAWLSTNLSKRISASLIFPSFPSLMIFCT
jgi:hypothetical protein